MCRRAAEIAEYLTFGFRTLGTLTLTGNKALCGMGFESRVVASPHNDEAA
ncbi:MAG: hypothetical protein QXS79_05545 [Candidatus Bathyarchaeia archaeon]